MTCGTKSGGCGTKKATTKKTEEPKKEKKTKK
jgi:hypothetical protein